MAAYVVADVDVFDVEKFEEYKRTVGPTCTEFAGEYVIRGGTFEVLEGQWTPARFVMIKFPSAEKAKAWWNSESYAGPKAIREACATSNIFLIDGV